MRSLQVAGLLFVISILASAIIGSPRLAIAMPIQASLHVALLLPVWGIAARGGNRAAVANSVWVAFAVLAAAYALYGLPDPIPHSSQRIVPQLAVAFVSVLAIVFIVPPNPETQRAGRARILGAVLLATALPIAYCIVDVLVVPGRRIAIHPSDSAWVQRFFVQLLLVPLSEELLFRGFLQSYLDRALPSYRRVLGARLGWGFVAQMLLFFLGHALKVLGIAPLQLSLYPAFDTIAAGVMLGWLRAWTQSLVPCFVVHGLANMCELLGR